MRSHASLPLLLLAAVTPVAAQEPPPSEAPRGSSQLAAGEVRYDAVGYATRGELPGVSIGSNDLATGSYVELTALDSGRTIVAAVVGDDAPMTGLAMVSNRAADALGAVGARFAVRVRKMTANPQDVAQLRGGGLAAPRADAPPALLVALRKKLPTAGAKPVVSAKPLPKLKAPLAKAAALPIAKPTPVPAATSGYVVQVAAVSTASRAAVVAKALGGTVVAGPPLWRVRLGPYPDATAAERAKADAARKGYPGGQITRTR